ncbi:hypothetical protein LBMAG42_54010 [Deltaproteobacteria bacterium]|nr:hypothetical protein LBMAG42_54010 [Deltaproteobacteria bacterium]
MTPPLLLLLGACPGFGTVALSSGASEVPEHPTYTEDAGPILDTYCSPCHGEDFSGSGHDEFRLDQYEGDGERLGAVDMVDRIEFRATGDNPTMPKAGANQPSDVEREILAAWIADGAAE